MKTKILGLVVLSIFIILGCGKVQVVAPKEPIKVDIAMRLDVYQHVERDINAIEDIVSGKGAKETSMLDLLVGTAYAEEELSAEVEQAAMRRNARYNDLMSAESKGLIGENNSGEVVLRETAGGDPSLSQLVSAENQDRMVIYRSLAKKNGISIGEVEKLYAKKLQASAPAGTPIQSASGEWQTK